MTGQTTVLSMVMTETGETQIEPLNKQLNHPNLITCTDGSFLTHRKDVQLLPVVSLLDFH